MIRKLLRFLCASPLLMLCMSALGTSNKIVVVSDIHVMAPSLLPSGAETQEAWTTYYAGQRKMLQQSAAIFDQFIQNMLTLQPKAVLITGDLTKDGETASHEYVRSGLETLEVAGINVYVIPGNHDFGAAGNHTQFNADGTTEDAPVLAYNEFQSFYYNHGYDSRESTFDPNSLSYTTELMEGLVLLAIDSHTASVSVATLEWLIEKAKAARNSGKQVIAMMHHPLFPHITGGDMYIDTYTVGDYAKVRDALINAGVNVILSGHFHTSDIARDWKDDKSKAVYDVNTGSLISYPCDYRILTPSSDFMTLSVATASIVPSGMTATECKTWLQGRAKSIAVQTMTEKAGAAATAFATQINNLAEFLADLFIVHAQGDEVGSADKAGLEERYTTYKNAFTYSAMLTAGGITDASIYSILEDESNYGTDKADVTKDRTLTINLPEVGPFKPTEPGTIESEFSVSEGKKVQFAKGNLQYSGYSHGMEAKWSMAKQQYEIFGEDNIEEQGSSTVPTSPKDLLCWSTPENYGGGYNYYDSSDEEAAPYFKGNFVDWGTDATLISNLGSGWSTLSTDEWSYLLNERENAAAKKAVATITIDDENTVKGLLLLPDEWTAPTGAPAIDGTPVALTLAQWTTLETAGAVFLPAAGQLTSTYDSNSWKTTTTLTPAGTYWTATPSADASGLKAMTLSFDDENVTVANDLNRRVMTAVRLVKALPAYIIGDVNGDAVVDIADAVCIVNHIVGKPTPVFIDAVADVNNDGAVDIADAVRIVNLIVGKIEALARQRESMELEAE